MRWISTLLITLFFSAVYFTSLAQVTGGKIHGKVQDETQNPIEFATLSLLKTGDSTLLKSAVSDRTGSFILQHVPAGNYTLKLSLVGHLTQSVPVEIKTENASIELKTITLQLKSNNLKEVAVVAKRPFFEQKADRMIVNVDAAPGNAGSTAMDILEKSPGITVDKDGKISLKGKQGVTIMIDNRPTYLSPTDLANYLKSLPASAIDQLEIMTNPSAKYDAAGNSGIINIKTKKNKAKGFNGSVTLTHSQCV